MINYNATITIIILLFVIIINYIDTYNFMIKYYMQLTVLIFCQLVCIK